MSCCKEPRGGAPGRLPPLVARLHSPRQPRQLGVERRAEALYCEHVRLGRKDGWWRTRGMIPTGPSKGYIAAVARGLRQRRTVLLLAVISRPR
eukprot:gene14602-biopygen1059